MGCYSPSEWELYRLQINLSGRRRRRMENHLARCDRCLQAYLSTIGGREEELAGLLLPPAFAARTARLIAGREKRARVEQLERRRRRILLLNYTAAAVVTLLLTAGGLFDLLARELPAAAEKTGATARSLQEILERDGEERFFEKLFNHPWKEENNS